MNIIFLDVDGVLNSIDNLIKICNKTNNRYFGFDYPFDEECLKNLKLIVTETNAKIVITSTWRRHEEGKNILLSVLNKYDLEKDIIGYTPFLNKSRGEEILQFLSTLEFKPNFIILDDDSDMGILLPYLVKTNIRTGLTYEKTIEAINKLNTPTKRIIKKK